MTERRSTTTNTGIASGEVTGILVFFSSKHDLTQSPKPLPASLLNSSFQSENVSNSIILT